MAEKKDPESFDDNLDSAIKAVEDALSTFNIPRLTEDSEFPNDRWNVFFQGEGKNISLSVAFGSVPAIGWLHLPVVSIVSLFQTEVQTLLSNPEAKKILVSDSDEFDLSETVTQFARSYIAHLSPVIFHSLHQVVSEVIIDHIKKIVEPNLREHWQALGLPDEFTLIQENKLAETQGLFPEVKLNLLNLLVAVDREFSDYRRLFFRDRKVWLNSEVMANLPNEYERLRKSYSNLKKNYKEHYSAFFMVNRRATDNDWEDYWQTFSDENFPDLFLEKEVSDFSASELAYKHLATIFGVSPSYMAKIISSSKD